MNKSNLSPHLLILLAGDLLVILSFVWIGRSNHHLSVTDLTADLSTAAPFILSWFLITPWFGLYQSEVSQNWRRVAPRLLLAWAIAGPLALMLRSLFLGRSIFGGIIPIFAVVSLTYIGVVALLWRLGYIGWVTHSLKQNNDVRKSKL